MLQLTTTRLPDLITARADIEPDDWGSFENDESRCISAAAVQEGASIGPGDWALDHLFPERRSGLAQPSAA